MADQRRSVGAIVLGVAAGFLGGLFGVGGGVLVVPGLVLWLGMVQHRAHATSLAAIVASSSAAVARAALADSVDWGNALVIFAGAGVGAWLGARAMARIPAVWLARIFVLFAVLTAARLALAGPGSGGGGGGVELTAAAVVGLVAIGLAAGALAATLGVGGGIVYVPALAVLFSVPQHLAQGTSLAAIAPTALVGTIAHARAGRVDWSAAVALGLGGVLGGILGVETALRLDALLLRRLFAVFLVLMVVRMLRQVRRHQPMASP